MRQSVVMKASRARKPLNRWGAGKAKNALRQSQWASGYGASFVAKTDNETATKNYRRQRKVKRKMVEASRRRNRPDNRGGM